MEAILAAAAGEGNDVVMTRRDTADKSVGHERIDYSWISVKQTEPGSGLGSGSNLVSHGRHYMHYERDRRLIAFL